MNCLLLLLLLFCCSGNFCGNNSCAGNICGRNTSNGSCQRENYGRKNCTEHKMCETVQRDRNCAEHKTCETVRRDREGTTDFSNMMNNGPCDKRTQFPYLEIEPRTCGCEEKANS